MKPAVTYTAPEQPGPDDHPVVIRWHSERDPNRLRRVGELLADILDNRTHSRRG